MDISILMGKTRSHGFFEQIVFTIIILFFEETDTKNASKSFSVQQLVVVRTNNLFE